MSKIKLKASIKRSDEKNISIYETIALKTNNKINYLDDLTNNVIVINDDVITLNRKNKEYEINLEFTLNKETFGSYLLKNYNKEIDIKIITKKIIKEDNKLLIEYIQDIYSDKVEISYLLEYEVIK